MTGTKNILREKITEFNRSFKVDRKLFAHDVRVSLIYCDALFHAGIITRTEAERIKSGLRTLLKRADFYKDYFEEPAATDIHSFIETRLVQLIGEAGTKLNIGRSRFDQTATAFRFWLREEIERISKSVRNLQIQFVEAGERQKDAILPAYAYSRPAQPILWAHWCLAFVEMFARDRERLDEVWRRVNVLPLGASDLAGTFIEIDREEIANALGFEGVTANSLDTVSDTDFQIEFVNAANLLAAHLSRLAIDLIFYGSAENKFLAFQTGELKIEDVFQTLEATRGKASKISAFQITLSATTKYLPLGVHQDAQENQAAIFETVEILNDCLEIVSMIFKIVSLNETRTLEVVSETAFHQNDLADYLVQRNVPREIASETARKIIAYARERGKSPSDLKLKEFQQFSEHFGEDVFQILSLENSLANRNQIGGTAPERVYEALEHAKETLNRENNN